MALICGILGRDDSATVRRMAAAMGVRGTHLHTMSAKDFAVAGNMPIGSAPSLLDGAPRGSSGNRLTPEAFHAYCGELADPRELDLTGSFAGVVSIDEGRRWWLARDRLGRKPLYYAVRDGVLVFASELKGILASNLVAKRLNLLGLDQYLTLRCVPGPETIIQGVNRVAPGHVVEFRNGELSQTLFAAFNFNTISLTRDEAAEHLTDRLRRSLAKTDSDVLLFTGGLDSASLAGLMPRLDPVFIQLERSWQNESRFARESARLMKRTLRVATARKLTEDAFSRAVQALDEPIADPSVLPLSLLFEEAGRHATTVITGHGADELLGGYPRYHFLQKTYGAHALIPVTLLGEIAPVLPPNAFIRRGSRFLASIRDDMAAYLSLIAVFDRDERLLMYTDVMRATLSDRDSSEPVVRQHFVHGDLTRNVLSLDLGVGLPDLLLAKWDSLAAASGVTLELPYLDDEIVDLATSLPPNTKFGVRSKPLLRMAVKGVVPARVRLRARRNFRIPMEGRLVQTIDAITRQIITRDRVEGIGVFKWQQVDQVVRSSTHNVYRRRQFWALLMFFAWYREFMEK